MDPQATLNELFAYLLSADNDDEDSHELALALVEWCERGGFVPDVGVAISRVINKRKETRNA